MRGRILTQPGNRKETFIADTGTSTPIVPKNVATRNGIKQGALDIDEPGCQRVTGDELTFIGQFTFFVKLIILKKAKKVRALVCSDEGCEILIDLQLLIDWTILPPNFPCPMDPREAEKSTVRWTKEKTKLVDIKERAVSQRTKLRFKDVSGKDFKTENFYKR